jgi:Na+/melibiose symporter-like transporter
MSNTSLAAQAVATVAPWLTLLALLAWCVPLLLMFAPVYRLARRRGRSLDWIWAVLLLGVINRMASDFLGMPPEFQHVSAIIIAALLAAVIRSYQHGDA